MTVLHAGAQGELPGLPALRSRVALHALHPVRRICDAFAYERGLLAVVSDTVALGRASGTAWINVTRHPELSSLLDLDIDACDELFGHMRDFPAWRAAREVVEQRPVPVTTLDAWTARNGVGHVDLLSLRTRGSELDALAGAEGLLATRSVSVIHLDVALRPCYRGQATFSEIDAFLSPRGYAFVDYHQPWHECGPVRRDGVGVWGESPRADRGHATYVAARLLRGEAPDLSATVSAALVIAQLGHGSTAAWMLEAHPDWRREWTSPWLDARARPSHTERWRAWLRLWIPPALSGR